ncbi:MAG TPA: metallophosphoesterase [Candidatus Acidoferrales bacterium]|nr:metallophosphoesterase [Candidatus Acidoferrales bacterium]
MRSRLSAFIAVIQSVLFLGHVIVYVTWIELWGVPPQPWLLVLQIALVLLSISFVTASILAFRWSNWFVRAFYGIASGWLGFLNFLACAAVLAWICYGIAWLGGWRTSGRAIVGALYGLALLVGIYGMLNALRVRTRRVDVNLPNLPETWRGRTAVFVSDLHLGHIRGARFCKKIVEMIAALAPDIVFIGGDLYDGTRVDPSRVTEPWSAMSAPLGTYLIAGNHEEFAGGASLRAAEGAGMSVLNDRKVVVEGMQIAGVDYRASASARRLELILHGMELDRNRASVLLSHSPNRLAVAERAGISLQLSGHTHRGQLIPSRWMVERIFGKYSYGLHAFGKMMVYTSSGVGTWGPPMRVGTASEIVLIRFDGVEG